MVGAALALELASYGKGYFKRIPGLGPLPLFSKDVCAFDVCLYNPTQVLTPVKELTRFAQSLKRFCQFSLLPVNAG